MGAETVGTGTPVPIARPPVPRHRAAALAAWVVIPLLGALWHLRNLRGTWWFFDEWSVIERVTHRTALDGMTSGFNGHLWAAEDVIYRVQVHVFGLATHRFAVGVYALVMLGMVLAVAAALRAGGVPLLVALSSAVLVTYLGVAAQNLLFAVQVSSMLSMVLCVAVTALVLRRHPTRAIAPLACGVLLLAVCCDSGYALSGVLLAVIVTLGAWPRRDAWIAVGPAVVAEVAWHVLADLGPRWPATVGVKAKFAVRLVLLTAGGLVGRAESAGVVLLVVAAVLLVSGLRRGHVTGPARALLVGGVPATLLTVAALAQSRAGVVRDDFASSNRYLLGVAVPLVLALLPACAASVRGLTAPWLAQLRAPAARSAVAVVVPPVLVALAFGGGLVPLRQYRAGFVAGNAVVRAAADSALVVLRDGCPDGGPPEPSSLPADRMSPQMSTALLAELVTRGALRARDDLEPDPAVVERMCPP